MNPAHPFIASIILLIIACLFVIYKQKHGKKVDNPDNLPSKDQIKAAFFAYFEVGAQYEPSIPSISTIGLTKVLVARIDGKLTLFVWVLRPGIFIGRQGRTIDGFTTNLKQVLGEPVDLRLEETNPWEFL